MFMRLQENDIDILYVLICNKPPVALFKMVK